MLKEHFFCCGEFQEFITYKHKSLEREYKFKQCRHCKKYFHILTSDIFTKELSKGDIVCSPLAKEMYKELRPNLIIEKPTIKYLKSLSYGVPARKTHNVYVKDENNRVVWDINYLKSKSNELVLDANQNPIILSKKMRVEEKIINPYQLIKISNCGKEQTVGSTLKATFEPTQELAAVG